LAARAVRKVSNVRAMKLTTPVTLLVCLHLSGAAAFARAAQAPPPPAAPEPPLPPAPPAPPPPAAPEPPAAQAPPAAPAPTPPKLANVLSKFSATLYGFVEADSIYDSTQSFNDLAGNAQIAKDGTYAGDHPRMTLGGRNTRIGFRFKGPDSDDVKTTAQMEFDFLGNQSPTVTSEAQTWASPILRVRHLNLKIETPFVDILAGQSWMLFGWQTYFHPGAVQIQGLPGQVFSRGPQLRLSHVFKTSPVNVELAVAAARPPQKNAGTPDGQGGLKITINDWKGVRTMGSAGTAADALGIGVSGVVRQFKLPEFTPTPVNQASKTGWGVSIDGLIPIVPATLDHRENALTLTGSFVKGTGIADLYTGLTGGVAFPTLPNPTMATPAPAYTADVDAGLVTFDAAGTLRTVDWQSYIVGLQYYLPVGGLWIAANYSAMKSDNIDEGITGAGLARLTKKSQFADGNLFLDVNPAVRVGLEYAYFEQTFADAAATKAKNHRVQLSFFYIF
jgi:hypothetical protein